MRKAECLPAGAPSDPTACDALHKAANDKAVAGTSATVEKYGLLIQALQRVAMVPAKGSK